MTDQDVPVDNDLVEWLAHGERGVSSETMVTELTGVYALRSSWGSPPSDPSDFKRCEKLLRQVPSLRPALGRMAEVSKEWARLVSRWYDIVGTLEEEIPGIFDDPDVRGSAPRTYELMKEIMRPPAPPAPAPVDDTALFMEDVFTDEYTYKDAKASIGRLLNHTDLVDHKQLVHPHNDVIALDNFMAGREATIEKLTGELGEALALSCENTRGEGCCPLSSRHTEDDKLNAAVVEAAKQVDACHDRVRNDPNNTAAWRELAKAHDALKERIAAFTAQKAQAISTADKHRHDARTALGGLCPLDEPGAAIDSCDDCVERNVCQALVRIER